MTVNTDILVPMTEADLDFQSQRWERVGTAADRLIAENLEAFQELAKRFLYGSVCGTRR